MMKKKTKNLLLDCKIEIGIYSLIFLDINKHSMEKILKM